MNDPLLLESENPLQDRLGKKFFEELPKEPGVYKMFGRKEMLLYVGKAKNLRRRLFTYRRIKSHTGSRKEKRLVRLVHKITYEVLPTEQEALLRENKLIRKHHPPLNRAKKSPHTYYFLSARPKGSHYTFDLGMNRREQQAKYTYGAFKGHRSIRKAVGALLRQLYILEHEITTPFQFPSQLINKLTPLNYELMIPEKAAVQIDPFLKGRSDKLLYMFVNNARQRNLLEPFIGKMILKDMESLQWFFQKAARRNCEMIQRLGLDSHIIPQEKLDDYLVQLAFMNGKGSTAR